MTMIKIYKSLLRVYGKQGWWPLFDSKSNKFRYFSGNPKNERQRLEICLGTILTQGTNWKNVEKALFNLIKNNLVDKNKLNKIKTDKLASLIRSSGYYKQKARKIKEFVKFLNSGKKIDRENLLDVWGIGEETADSILLYAFNKPCFVVDAYTKRIFSRLSYCDENIRYNELQKLIAGKIPKDINLYKEFHALLVEHGKNLK